MNAAPSSAAAEAVASGSSDSENTVVVLGSANIDIVFTVARIPQPGETLLADSADSYPGGKGLNQAVAAARAGARTVFIGALGDDENGRALTGVMADAAINRDLVRHSDLPTGQAFIVVDSGGENVIVVASGANGTVTRLTETDRKTVAAASVLLMQLELPLDVVSEAATVAHVAGTAVILNAAPAFELTSEVLRSLDYLIVNEHEACLLGGSDNLHAASGILAAQVEQVIVTLGSAGSVLWRSGTELARVPALNVTAIDTTGAGDTYCGAFAAALAEGQQFEQAATFASAAAALSVQCIGAVPSVPARAAIERMLTS